MPGYVRASGRVALVLAVLLVVGFSLWKIPILMLAPYESRLQLPEYLKQVNAYRATLAQIVGGIVLLVGLYFGWRRLDAAERTVQISQEGQITERFTRAVEHLGSDKLPVRVGGVYALERIARDSSRDHWAIIELLSTFVREQASWPLEERTPEPKMDVQAVLTVIGRLHRAEYASQAWLIDLSGTDLRGYQLRGAYLEGALFYGAHMELSHLESANLRRAKLVGSYLNQAWMEGTDLEDAELRHAHLESTILTNANLRNANCSRAILNNADVLSANLTGAILTGAYAEEADFSEAILEEADLRSARLRGATFEGANLRHANIAAASLTDAVGLTNKQLLSAKGAPRDLPSYLQMSENSGA